MIRTAGGIFRLETADTEYIFRLTKNGHLEHIYYGSRHISLGMVWPDIEALAPKRTAQIGSTVAYTRDDPLYCLDTMCLEWSGTGKGDYRYSPSEIKMPDGGFVTDFVYESHSVCAGSIPMDSPPSGALPFAGGRENDCESLSLQLRDKACNVHLTIIYTVYEAENVIARRVVLENGEAASLVIRRLLSMSLDMPDTGFNF
jgi:alpha-galactosidase